MSDDESSTNPTTTPADTGNNISKENGESPCDIPLAISTTNSDGLEMEAGEEKESDASFAGFESHTGGVNEDGDEDGDGNNIDDWDNGKNIVETDTNLPKDEASHSSNDNETRSNTNDNDDDEDGGKAIVETDTNLPKDEASNSSNDNDASFAAFETCSDTNDNDDESGSVVILPPDVSRSQSSADELDTSFTEKEENINSNDNNDDGVEVEDNIPQVDSSQKTAVDDSKETERVEDSDEPTEPETDKMTTVVTESESDAPSPEAEGLVPTCRFLKTKLPTSVGNSFDTNGDEEICNDDIGGISEVNPGTTDHEVDPTKTANNIDTAKSSSPANSPTKSPKQVGKELSTVVPPSSQEKNRCFQNLRSYEAKRRQIYTAKLASSSYYWRAFRELLSYSLQETERVEVVVKGGLLAAQNYYETLMAAAEDRLDWNGMAVTDPAKMKKLKVDRWRKYSRLGSGGKSPFAMLHDQLGTQKDKKITVSESMEEDAKEKMTAEENAADLGILNCRQESVIDSNSLIHSLLESQSAMADRFKENISFVNDVSLKKIILLKQELEGEVYIMTMLGDAIVEELERAEQDVQDAWCAYYTMVRGNFDTSTNSKNVDFPGEFTPSDISDVWVVEMHYRMSVAYLTTTWEHSSAELSKIFQSMKEVECNRRYRLRELLLLHMQRQERLWLSIPGLVAPVVKDLMDRPTDLPTVEKSVQTHIRGRAAAIKREKDTAEVKKLATQKTKSPRQTSGLSCAEDLNPDYELVSPLMSELMLKADVVEKKSDAGIIGKWKTTLVVATSDSFLHFFDIPPGSGVRPGSAAEVAFQALVPPIAVPNEDMIKNGKIVYGKSWYEYLIPAESISLKKSTISLNESKGDCIFEVTENVESTGAAKIFNMKTTRKFSIRLFSNHEMVNWLLALGMAT